MEEDDEIFDLGTLGEYELLSNEDGSVLIQENHVAIKHQENGVIKLLPMTEEVLQALGLAVVTDDEPEDKKVKIEILEEERTAEELMEHEEFMEVPVMDPPGDEETTDTSAVATSGNDQNNITIVFTDDEDAELCKMSNAAKSSSGETLYWSHNMVNELLDLYEEHQQEFVSGSPRHRTLWKSIHQAMCKSHPSLERCTESHIQSKFSSLKRTYRGALEYLQDNMHTSKWPFFTRMHEIMEKQAAMTSDLNSTQDAEENTSGDTTKKDAPWLRNWTPLLLDAHIDLFDTRESRGHFANVVARMSRMDPRCARLSQARARRKLDELRALYRLPEQRERLLDAKVLAKLKQMETLASTEGSKPGKVWDPEPDVWPAQCVSTLLGLLAVNRRTPIEQIAHEMREQLGAQDNVNRWMSVAAVAKQVHKLKVRYQSLSAGIKGTTNWVHYQQAAEVWGPPPESWSSANTQVLLQHYEQVAQVLDESGPKFWAELVRRFNRSRLGFKITSSKCEMKMQALCVRYQNMLRCEPDRQKNVKNWPLFEAMHRIFGNTVESSPWPSRTVEFLLSIYQREMPRLESGDHTKVWQDIAQGVSEVNGEPRTAKDCKQKLLELKQKYCKVMKDEEAAKAWPFYKRMSELFSSPLWSKHNVNLLLDVYEEFKDRIEGVPEAEATAAWQEAAERFNGASVSSCVSAVQCRTELHVLQARRRALLQAGPGQQSWPFLKRMNEIFGSEFEAVTVGKERTPERSNGKNNEDEYIWTEEAVNHLLELYHKNRHLFGTESRKAVWQRIDTALAELDHNYSPDKKGAGGWFKYLDIMTKYMDIKERRCHEKDWPFYERMEAIFSKKPKAASVSSEPSDAASQRSASPSYELETMLRTPNRSRKRMIGDSDFQGVFIKETKKPAIMKTKDPGEEEATSLELLAQYSKHLQLLKSKTTSATIEASKERTWAHIAKQMGSFDPNFSKTAEQCRKVVEDIEAGYKRMKANKGRVTTRQRLAPKIFEKMKEIEKLQNGDLDDTDDAEAATQTILPDNSEVLQALLQEMVKKNEIGERRIALLQKHHKERNLHHAETMNMMKRILKALSDPLVSADKSDILNMLEQTMEEIHK